MARPQSPDGHRIHVNIKLSDAEAAAIDAARGTTERGPWMREAALAVARRDPGIPRLTNFGTSVKPGTVTAVSVRREDGEIKVSAASAVNVTPGEPAPKTCPPHPKARVNKGLCGACGRNVGK